MLVDQAMLVDQVAVEGWEVQLIRHWHEQVARH
jgi:hypothetical protein